MLKMNGAISAVLTVLVVTAPTAAIADDAQKAMSRSLLMHSNTDTETCFLVKQRLAAIEKSSDEQGHVASIPLIETRMIEAPCTSQAFPYEESPGLRSDSRITAKVVPWRDGVLELG